MSAEEDFGLWERELHDPEAEPGDRGMLLVAGVTAAGCTALIALGAPQLGVAGLVLSAVILLLWRLGL